MFFEVEIDESPISMLAVKIYSWFGFTLIFAFALVQTHAMFFFG